ncbi:hypothetical protein F5I97DRAFT_1829179 [Phlebopus sp. FC_14]|nr:hypothetical protein F5I97DRAFT_1829179 [Phlebopus sp. FC_14]
MDKETNDDCRRNLRDRKAGTRKYLVPPPPGRDDTPLQPTKHDNYPNPDPQTRSVLSSWLKVVVVVVLLEKNKRVPPIWSTCVNIFADAASTEEKENLFTYSQDTFTRFNDVHVRNSRCKRGCVCFVRSASLSEQDVGPVFDCVNLDVLSSSVVILWNVGKSVASRRRQKSREGR